MTILKEGLLLKNKLFFEQTSKPYYCSLCYGTWSPSIPTSELIFNSEILQTRITPTITTGWNSSSEQDYVDISFDFNYPENVIFNRVVLYYGGLQRCIYDVIFNGFNSLTITSPAQNNFSPGDRILYNNYFYTVQTVSGLDIGVTKEPLVPDLPSSGSGTIRDASGIPLIGIVLDNVYQINYNTTINFYINATSNI